MPNSYFTVTSTDTTSNYSVHVEQYRSVCGMTTSEIDVQWIQPRISITLPDGTTSRSLIKKDISAPEVISDDGVYSPDQITIPFNPEKLADTLILALRINTHTSTEMKLEKHEVVVNKAIIARWVSMILLRGYDEALMGMAIQNYETPPSVPPVNIVERCAQELEWMSRGHVAHEAILLQATAKRLRDEADKIITRASGKPA